MLIFVPLVKKIFSELGGALLGMLAPAIVAYILARIGLKKKSKTINDEITILNKIVKEMEIISKREENIIEILNKEKEGFKKGLHLPHNLCKIREGKIWRR